MIETQEQMAKYMSEQGETDIASPEITMEMVEQVCISSFILNPRFLYEFFDPAGIFVIVKRDEDKWYFELDGERNETAFEARILAEGAGFKHAIIKHEKRENGEQN